MCRTLSVRDPLAKPRHNKAISASYATAVSPFDRRHSLPAPLNAVCHEQRKVVAMFYIVESDKSPVQAAIDLEAAVKRHGFGVLHVHYLTETLRAKGFEFPNECRIFEVCNPAQAVGVLSSNMNLNMALPCRISVYQEGEITKIGMIRPTVMLSQLSSEAELASIAEQVEIKTKAMIDEAK